MTTRALLALGLASTLACGTPADDRPEMDMSAEDHAHMHGAGGATDSTGALVRQPVLLTEAQERALGVTYLAVRRDTLELTIRTVGRIEVAEPNIVDVTPKISGFVERLFVNSTGASVRRGEPLLTLYSPELVAAQEELLTATRLVERLAPDAGEARRNAIAMLDAARRRLSYWDITEAQIGQIEADGEPTKALTLVSPSAGVVLAKDVIEGQRVMDGQRLYQIADLSEVWVEGDVFEQDLQYVREGSQAHIEVSAYPGEHIMGRVSFVYPTVEERSRTNRVRVTVANRGLRLKPGMFATVYFDALVGTDILTVPLDAVVVTGERNVVFVHHDDGTLMPHEVVLGTRARDRVQVLSGLAAGEMIVASANFLVDAESRLGGTAGSMPGMQHGDHGSVVEPDEPAPMEHQHD
jgi:Cu(I)/Ag(I) efflux system membrane fusion protein